MLFGTGKRIGCPFEFYLPLKSTSPLRSESKMSTTRLTSGFSFNSGTDTNSPILMVPDRSKSSLWKRFSNLCTSSGEKASTRGNDELWPIVASLKKKSWNYFIKVSVWRVLDRNLEKKISKFQEKRKNSSKFVYVVAKQCRSHFNLTNFLTNNLKILISHIFDIVTKTFQLKLVGTPCTSDF